MVEFFPAMTWRSRPDMSCEYLSQSWLDFTGYASDAALGDGWSRGVHPEDLPRWLDTCLRAYDSRQPYEIEYRLRRGDGEYRWVLDRGEPRYDAEGLFAGYAGVCVDIDELKRAEAELTRALERERKLRIGAEEASRLRDGFLATVLQDFHKRNAEAQNRIIAELLELARERLLSGVRVLVVEDDPGARDAMLKVLNGAGAEAKSAASGREAAQALQAWRPDVLLSDQGGCLRAAAAGYDTRLAKPVEPVTLLATLTRLVRTAAL
jgi:PAS domain S-box-containing protein